MTNRSKSRTIRIVSYNIHKGLAAGNSRYVLAEIRNALRILEPDIVLLQEVVGQHERFQQRFAQWPHNAQFEYLADSIWSHYAYGRNAIYSGGDHGNAVMSKYTLSECENIDLSLTRWERRGLLHAQIRTPFSSRPIHICSVHLNLLQQHRRRQVAMLAARIRAAVPAACPLVIGGDFNDWRRTATRYLREQIDVIDTYEACHGQHARTYPAWGPSLSLDRIYIRGFEVVSAHVLNSPLWRRLSDHLGLHVVVRSMESA